MRNQDIDLVLSTDAKPRLKWTVELHRRFIDAVAQLGGPEKATPKSLMRVMCIPGLTLYHLKSHLQKYRLGKNQPSQTSYDNGHEEVDYTEFEIIGGDSNSEIMDKTDTEINDMHIAQALQVQMEVQKKLHEQIEVQRHLQMRIEAQGMYLQSILKKAQDTLAGYNSSSVELEALRTHVVSNFDIQNQSSPLSGLTETGSFSLEPTEKKSLRSRGGTDCSMDSSLTSSESSGQKDHEKLKNIEMGYTHHECNRIIPNVLTLLEIDPNGSSNTSKTVSSYRSAGRKRSRSNISDDQTCVEQQPSSKKSVVVVSSCHQVKQLRNLGSLKKLDLNSKYEMESGLQDLDLNCGVNL